MSDLLRAAQGLGVISGSSSISCASSMCLVLEDLFVTYFSLSNSFVYGRIFCNINAVINDFCNIDALYIFCASS